MLTKSKSVLLSMVVCIVLTLALATSPAQAPIISPAVPYHSQTQGYYCGPACLEMVFDFYGPDISQSEIADAARADGTYPNPYGTYTYEMVRAAHFSDLSTSAGEISPHVTGYTARDLGYAAFAAYLTLDQLKTLIDSGYPIAVLQWNALTHDWGHFRVVVGYNDTHITVHDPLPSYFPPGPNNVYSYSDFNNLWAYSGKWALFTHPWDVSVSSPASVAQGATFTVTTTITYPRPSPFSAAYSASSSEATIQLPAGLSLATGETATKSLGTIASGSSTTVQWDVDADSAGGPYTITVEAEGQVTGSVSGHSAGVFTTGYTYTDRIGGSNTAATTVTGAVTYDATISAYCNTEGSSVGVAVSMDGASTGFNTPHTFTISGSHTFTVPNVDPSGHPFKQWSTGETTTTITVNSAGTYIAYYEEMVVTYDVTINAHCNTEGADVSVAIAMDGAPTGFNTPHTFSISGSHTFNVPSADPSGHSFKEWSTGETTTTITVNSAGTYVAYYEAAVVPGVPEFGASLSVMTSCCAMLYLLIRKRQRIK